MDDVFCKIIAGEIKADVVYRDDDFIVIKDINPQAPVHLLIIPAEHHLNIHDFKGKETLLGKAFLTADKVAHDMKLEKGYRLILNEGEDGGKLVPHLHIHLLGGKKLGPKMVR
ncbi:MAG: HIT domain-containing protein [Candidatus Taylorbacteria bacterium]|nr:HIT domain-containing protein [Candidatus Taylorbacteria bacterium]